MGSGLLRELLILEKIGYGGVYVTDPFAPTFSEPKLTPWGQQCATVGKICDLTSLLMAPQGFAFVGPCDF